MNASICCWGGREESLNQVSKTGPAVMMITVIRGMHMQNKMHHTLLWLVFLHPIYKVVFGDRSILCVYSIYHWQYQSSALISVCSLNSHASPFNMYSTVLSPWKEHSTSESICTHMMHRMLATNAQLISILKKNMHSSET